MQRPYALGNRSARYFEKINRLAEKPGLRWLLKVKSAGHTPRGKAAGAF